MKRRTPRRAGPTPLLPRSRKERRTAELLGGASLVLVVFLIIASWGLSGLLPLTLRDTNVAAVVSATLVGLANADRASESLPPLTVDPKLVAAAQAKADDMAKKGYFAHTSPEGVDPWYWFKQEGYQFIYAGENLAVDFSDSGDVNTAWMNSPEHRANLLDQRYTQIGIATAQGEFEGRAAIFVVQEFGAPAPGGAQEATIAQNVPVKATQPASARAKPVRVLGAAEDKGAPAPAVPARIAASPSDVPWWGFLVAFPRDSLRYAYYSLGALILLALAADTGFEMKRHHRRKAMIAGGLLFAMCALFVSADALFFVKPVLAATAGAPGL